MNLSPTFTEHAARIETRRRALKECCAQLFAGRDTFVWEIGCGHGHFLNAYAAAHPGKWCVGIDLILERLGRAERKRGRSGAANARFVRAEAGAFLDALPEGVRPSEIFILFPDPWPKRRHRDRRLLSPAFVARLGALAAPGARMYLKTDYTPYFLEARAALAGSHAWRLREGPWPFDAPTIFQERAESFHALAAERA